MSAFAQYQASEVQRRFDFWPFAEALVQDLQATAAARATRLVNAIPEELVVSADAVVLRRVLQNLVANALAFTANGEVVVSAVSGGDDGSAVLLVRDTGTGIPPERLAQVFEKHETHAARPSGRGAIVNPSPDEPADAVLLAVSGGRGGQPLYDSLPIMTRRYITICVALAAFALSRPAGGQGVPAAQGAEADVALLARFDRNGNGRLERDERDAARAHLAANPALRPPMRSQKLPATGVPGERISPNDVPRYPARVPLYDAGALRTIFLTFEHDDWERELADFWHTDVEVPAILEVDGQRYRDIGVSFRGNNSFHMIPDGLKRSFSINMDTWRKQELLGHTSLNLLNANQDPTFLRSVLYLDIAREYIPAPKASFVRVVVNGESWGLFVNQQTFSKQLLQEQLGTSGGTRWKSPNNSYGGGFNFLGDDLAAYRRWYEQKGKDDTTAWRALVHVTRVLSITPAEQLEQALAAHMDIDEVLRFLALDVALVNGDGYWNDGSDFNVLRGVDGRFRLLPHDANEAFRLRSNGTAPDPLIAMADTNKALRSRLLVVPALRTRYLQYVAEIAERQLDWSTFGARVARYTALIGRDVARDTRKTATLEAFTAGVDSLGAATTSLRAFADRRRAALLGHPEVVRARTPP